MPERITVVRTFTYDVAQAVADIREMSEHPDPNDLEIGLDEVMEYLEDWVFDDMRSPVSRHDLAYFDENGEEL
jgi:hypothetical protein